MPPSPCKDSRIDHSNHSYTHNTSTSCPDMCNSGACSTSYFFFNDTATTEIYPLSPTRRSSDLNYEFAPSEIVPGFITHQTARSDDFGRMPEARTRTGETRSEEHTSELQSP